MFTGRMLSLFVMALVVFYPIEKGWAQTTPSPKAAGTGFQNIDELLPTMRLAIAIPEPNQEPKATMEVELNGETCTHHVSVDLSQSFQEMFKNTQIRCTVEYQEFFRGNSRQDEPDAQSIRLLMTTPGSFDVPFFGEASCVVGAQVLHGRLGEQKIEVIAGLQLVGTPLCVTYDPENGDFSLMAELKLN